VFPAVLIAASLTPALQGSSISVVSPAQANVNNQFQVNVFANQVVDLYAWQFDLTFDPSILQLASIQEGSFLASGGSTVFIPGTIDNVLGTATFTIDSLVGPISGVSGTGDLADFLFTPTNTGTSALDLSNVSLLDSNFNDIPVTQLDSSVDVETAVTPEPALPLWMVTSFALLGIVAYRRKRLLVRS
jgi:general secretion pathway protein D